MRGRLDEPGLSLPAGGISFKVRLYGVFRHHHNGTGEAQRQAVCSWASNKNNLSVYDVLQYLASGMTHAEILRDFPYLTEQDIRACLALRLTESANWKCSTRELLLDENLPLRLIKDLADLFPGSTHVHECGVGNARTTLPFGNTPRPTASQ